MYWWIREENPEMTCCIYGAWTSSWHHQCGKLIHTSASHTCYQPRAWTWLGRTPSPSPITESDVVHHTGRHETSWNTAIVLVHFITKPVYFTYKQQKCHTSCIQNQLRLETQNAIHLPSENLCPSSRAAWKPGGICLGITCASCACCAFPIGTRWTTCSKGVPSLPFMTEWK